MMNALGMLVEFSAACPSSNRLDLGYLRHEALGNQTKPIGLGQRYPWVELKLGRYRTLVERRQEAARQKHRANSGGNHGHRDADDQHRTVVESPVEQDLRATLGIAKQV